MPGPNSAPNGDGGLVRGSSRERTIWCERCDEFVPARSDALRHAALRTGKTEAARKR